MNQSVAQSRVENLTLGTVDVRGVESDHHSMILTRDSADRVDPDSVTKLSGCRTHGVMLEETIGPGRDAWEGGIDQGRVDRRSILAPRCLDLEGANSQLERQAERNDAD